MKVGVLADSHDNLNTIQKAVEKFFKEGVECILHAGDFVAPFAMKALLKSGIRLVGVFGNNDGEKIGLRALCKEVHEPPYLFELAGRRILLAHYKEQVRQKLIEQADIFIYGHTHEFEIKEGKPLFINPGECGGWVFNRPSAGVINLESLEAHVFFL